MLLEHIHSPADVRALDETQLPVLCQELREFLIQSVSKTGGHLASNLGAVELTVAIHRVFDTAKDRLVFDVGHQCYVHKALTGRQELFSTLRQFSGLSGFPKPWESPHDAFIAGHASNSVSVALGMARARTLLHKEYQVLALIGDGALTGGLAYEGINNAGASGEALTVILNDNGMSISPNVGGLTKHLNRLRSLPSYYHFKKWYWGLFGKHPDKHALYRFNHRLKLALKRTLLPSSSLFEDMGFTYLGPVDGHDLPCLCEMLRRAKEMHCPVLLHVKTQKGRGYAFAEKNPDSFHGVGPFDIKTGQLLNAGAESWSHTFGEILTEYAAKDPRICAITAAMTDGTGLNTFAKKYPDRFFDVAIAEGHGVSMAAGLASQGMIPVFAVYSTFLQRGYDMLIHDTALEKLHVVFAVDRAGLVGQDGETHHGCFDVPFLCGIPGFTVLCPANYSELRTMLYQALFEIPGPVAVRYPRGGEGKFKDNASPTGEACKDNAFPTGEARKDNASGKTLSCLCRTDIPAEIALVSYGILINTVLDAAEALKQQGIQAEVWKLNQIAPLDGNELCTTLGKRKILLVLEDCSGEGCVGQRLAADLCAGGCAPERLILKNLGNQFAPAGSVAELMRSFGLDAQSIARSVMSAAREADK